MVTNKYVPIKTETVKAFADEARRLGETEEELTTDQMIGIFSSLIAGGAVIPPNASLYYFSSVESNLNLNFTTSAVGALE